MKKQIKMSLCVILLIIGLTSFILQVFVFGAPDGMIGFLLCLVSIFLIISSIIKLCQLSVRVKNIIFDILDLLFFMG